MTRADRIVEHREICGRCRRQRTRTVDWRVGEYLVLMPGACPDKAACERELMADFIFTPRDTLEIEARDQRRKTPGHDAAEAFPSFVGHKPP